MNERMRVLSSAKTARSLDENPRAMHASFSSARRRFLPSVTGDRRRRALSSSVAVAQRTAVPRRVFRKYHMRIQYVVMMIIIHLKKRRIESHLASRISQSNRSITLFHFHLDR